MSSFCWPLPRLLRRSLLCHVEGFCRTPSSRTHEVCVCVCVCWPCTLHSQSIVRPDTRRSNMKHSTKTNATYTWLPACASSSYRSYIILQILWRSKLQWPSVRCWYLAALFSTWSILVLKTFGLWWREGNLTLIHPSPETTKFNVLPPYSSAKVIQSRWG